MALDPSIPLQASNQGGMQTFAQMAGLANTMQGMQARQLQMQGMQNQNVQTGIDAQEMQNLQPVLRNIDDYTDPNGNIDFNKFVPAVMKVAPKNGMAVIQQAALGMQQKAAAQNAISGQSLEGRQAAANAIYSLSPDSSSEDIQKTKNAVVSTFNDPNAQTAAGKQFDDLLAVKATSPDHFPVAQKHAAAMFVPQQTQQSMSNPEGVTVNNGVTTKVVSTKPGTTVAQGQVIPGTEATLHAPQQFISDPGGNLHLVGGASGSGASQGGTGGANPNGWVNTPQALNQQDNIKEMNAHFASLQDAASGNQLVQSLTGNIKNLAQKAITGTESDKLAYANGLLAALPGHGHADDLKTANDLLEKNMAQLNLSTPASSDAARGLISAARPHSTMTPEAISEASDQLASQVQANTAIRNHLAGYKFANNGSGDAAGYQRERQQIESVADPRAWQYMNLKPGSPQAKAFAQQHPEI